MHMCPISVCRRRQYSKHCGDDHGGLSRSPFDLLSQSLQLNSSPDPWSITRTSIDLGGWPITVFPYASCRKTIPLLSHSIDLNLTGVVLVSIFPFCCCSSSSHRSLLVSRLLLSLLFCVFPSALLRAPVSNFVLWLCRASQRPSPGPPGLRQLALQRKVKKKTLLPHVSPARPLLQTLLQTLLQAPAACNGSRLKSCWSAL